MSGIPPWFRVPVQLIQSEPEEARGWIYLLGQWHIGATPGHNEIRRALGWGAGRVQRFIPKAAKWALEHGASVPAEVAEHFRSSSGAVAEQQRSTIGAGQPALIEDNHGVPEQERSRSGAVAEQQRSDSRAGDPFREIKKEIREEIRSELRPSAIPAQTPQVHLFPPIGFPAPEPLQAPALAETPPPAPEAPISQARAVSGASEEKPAALHPDLMAVWQAWKSWRPSSGMTPPDSVIPMLKAAVKKYKAELVIDVIRWAQGSPHSRARFLRGERNGVVDRNELCTLKTVLRHLDEYGEFARIEADPQAWQQASGSGPIILDPDGNVEPIKPQKAASNRANSIDSAASTYSLAQQLRAEEEAQHGFGG